MPEADSSWPESAAEQLHGEVADLLQQLRYAKEGASVLVLKQLKPLEAPLSSHEWKRVIQRTSPAQLNELLDALKKELELRKLIFQPPDDGKPKNKEWEVPPPPHMIEFSTLVLAKTDGDQRATAQRKPGTSTLTDTEDIIAQPVHKEDSLAGELQQLKLKTGKRHYNKSTAQRAFHLTSATYHSFHPPGEEAFQNYWKELIVTKSSDRVICSLPKAHAANSDTMEIGIRGRQSLAECSDHHLLDIGNADCALVKMDGMDGLVHKGFREAYCFDGIQEVVKKNVEEWLSGARTKLLICGHSRGAALATLCAVDLARMFPQCHVDLVTYGSPAVGDAAFAAFCTSLPNLRIARYVNKFDIVPYLPLNKASCPKWLATLMETKLMEKLASGSYSSDHYQHVGDEVVLDPIFEHFGRFIESPELLFKQHLMDCYGANLRNSFRSLNAVRFEAYVSVCLKVATLIMRAVASQLPYGQMYMKALEPGEPNTDVVAAVKESTAEICDRIREDQGRILDAVEEVPRKVSFSMQEEFARQELMALKAKTDCLYSNLDANIGGQGGHWHTPIVEKINLVLQNVEHFEGETARENLCSHILNAFLAIAHTYIELQEDPIELLNLAHALMRPEREGKKFLSLLAEVIQAAAKRAKLKREDVQRFLSDCAWPEEKPVPQVITMLRSLRHLLVNATVLTRGRRNGEGGPALGMLQTMSLSIDPEAFSPRDQESAKEWQGWRCKSTGNEVSWWPLDRVEFVDATGSSYKGGWRHGKPQGDGEAVYFENGVKMYTYRGQWQEGVMHGCGCMSMPDATVLHDGIWNSGSPVRQGVLHKLLLQLAELQGMDYDGTLTLDPMESSTNKKEVCQQALTLDARNSHAWLSLGLIGGGEVGADSYSRKRCCEEALLHESHCAEAWFELGVQGGGKTTEHGDVSSKACYEQALRHKPDHADAWFGLAMEGGGLVGGKPHSKKECYEQCLHYNPDHAIAWNSLGKLIIDSSSVENDECGKACFEKAVRHWHNFADAWCNLAIMEEGEASEKTCCERALTCAVKEEMEAGERSHCKKDGYKEALLPKVNHAQMWYRLGVLGGGETSDTSCEPSTCYERALDYNDNHYMAWCKLAQPKIGGGNVGGNSYGRKACYEKALRHELENGSAIVYSSGPRARCEKALHHELQNSGADAWLFLGTAGGGRVGTVSYNKKACCEKALQYEPASAEAWYGLGREGGGAFQTTFYDKKACYIRALQCDDTYAEAWNGLGTLKGGSVGGVKYRQQECYEMALKHDKEYAVAWENLGRMLGGPARTTVHGESCDRKACMEKALDLEHDDAKVWEAWYWLGDEGGGTTRGTDYKPQACAVRALEITPDDADAWDLLARHSFPGVGVKVRGREYDKYACYAEKKRCNERKGRV